MGGSNHKALVFSCLVIQPPARRISTDPLGTFGPWGVSRPYSVYFSFLSQIIALVERSLWIFRGQDLSTYRDQTDIFFDSPTTYFNKTFPESVDPEFPPSYSSTPGVSFARDLDQDVSAYPWRHTWPRHLVLFGALLEKSNVKEVLEEKGYVEIWRRGREWEGEGQRKGGVRVWTWQD